MQSGKTFDAPPSSENLLTIYIMQPVYSVNFTVDTLTHEMDLTLWTDDAALATPDIDSITYPELVLERIRQLPTLCAALGAIDAAGVLDGQCSITEGRHVGITTVEEDDLMVDVDAPANWREAFALT